MVPVWSLMLPRRNEHPAVNGGVLNTAPSSCLALQLLTQHLPLPKAETGALVNIAVCSSLI